MKNFRFLYFILVISFFSSFLISCENTSESDTSKNYTTHQRGSNLEKEITSIANKYGGTIEFTPNPSIDSYQLSSLEEFEMIISDIHNSTKTPIKLELVEDHGNKTTYGCNDGIYYGSTSAGMGSLGFWVTVKNGQISGVSSALTGFHLGMSWAQQAYSISGNSVTVSGVYTGVFFLEGIGPVWSYPATYIINLPC